MSHAARLVRDLADAVGGVVEGDGNRSIAGPAGLEDAGPDQIAFLANRKYLRSAQASQAGAIVLGTDVPAPNASSVLVRVSNPSKAFAAVCELFMPPLRRPAPGVDALARIDPSARLGVGVSIQAGAVVEEGVEIGADTVIGPNVHLEAGVRIGERCRLFANVVVRERCLIGNDCILHPGVVVGADGFGFDLSEGEASKIPQMGIVRIDDRVEIGANTTIDRARFGQTWIQDGAKIDNLVQIAHNVVIGKRSIIAAQAGISGSTRIGQGVLIAGQVGLVGHIRVGDGAILCAQSGISKDVPHGTMVAGYHAQPIREAQKIEAAMRRLPEMMQRLRALERRMGCEEGREPAEGAGADTGDE